MPCAPSDAVDGDAPGVVVSVRALCAFAAKDGDLETRFTPAPSALEGIEGHAFVALRRGDGYRREVTLSGRFGALSVRGRADGYDAAARRLDEVKTHRGSLDRQPGNLRRLHWAQARVYGWLLCARDGFDALDVALVYLDIDSQRETVFVERCDAASLRAHFERLCATYLAWAERARAHRCARDAALRRLAFPHPAFRAGQRALAAAVYRAARAEGVLLAQAPTGSGKTIGTLFPLLKAMPERLDRVFFLTAKTSARALALAALQSLREREPALPLRALELVARDKACEHPDKACHGASCPLARGFFDRLPAAREAALDAPLWDRAAVRAIALVHAVCPYWLGQELARWSDVVVGDYNHFFDGSALLHGLTLEQGWRVGVLVDEAHNLVARGREMYSATLQQAALKRLRRRAPVALKPALDRLHRRWNESNRGQPAAYRELGEPPAKWLTALAQCTSAIADHLAEAAAAPDAELQAFYFDALHLLRLADAFGPHSLYDAAPAAGGWTLGLRNVQPAPFLAPRFAAARTTTLFSATLEPRPYYRELLGLPDATANVDVESPFDARQLSVRIARGLSTRWRDRARSVPRVVERIAAQFRERPGNYLAFFGSYDYLEQVAGSFAAAHADVPAWRQSRGMSEGEQRAFLDRFVAGGRGVGFAVLGGAFAEAVDLPGERLVGAFIATLGMPQVGAVNEAMRRRLDGLCDGAGFDYVYLYPGLQKVAQAAGRVIRTTSDVGVVHLLDERFAEPRVRRLLPRWWRV